MTDQAPITVRREDRDDLNARMIVDLHPEAIVRIEDDGSVSVSCHGLWIHLGTEATVSGQFIDTGEWWIEDLHMLVIGAAMRRDADMESVPPTA